MAGAKKLRVNVTVPEGFQPGDTFVIEVEVPSRMGRKRITKPIDEMSHEELKREIINAGSVLYKAQKRGADEEIIERNQARLDAAKALMEEKFPKQVKKRTSNGTVIMQADARILTQDEIDHPENYIDGDDTYVQTDDQYDADGVEI
jgi:preprotein translocase subunit SecD